jgi:adenylylsulfate kinase
MRNLDAPLDALPLTHSPGLTVWLTGLSGAGKSTLARALMRQLGAIGQACCVIDGDELRGGLSRDLGFSLDDRMENVRRAAEMARLLNDQGLHALVALISPMTAHREQARAIVGAERYIEVYVRTRPEVCESRDPKGLYKQARQSTLSHFTGITSPYEAPTAAALEIDTSVSSVEASCDLVQACMRQRSPAPGGVAR